MSHITTFTVLSEEDFSLETIEKFIDKPQRNWASLSFNKNLTLSFLEKHLDKPWNFENLSSNHSISLDIIEKLVDYGLVEFPKYRIKQIQFPYGKSSMNKNLSICWKKMGGKAKS